ncbi:MAG: hypothetical protein IJY16_04865 [Clostridia bacterium]|nr:hypothetical protein [Clostridia bacterium]
MKKMLCLILIVLLIFLTACASGPSYKKAQKLLSSYEGDVIIRTYCAEFLQGTMFFVSSGCIDRAVDDAATRIVKGLAELELTGEVEEKISDEILKFDIVQNDLHLKKHEALVLPVPIGTYWIEVDDLIYRVTEERICLVDTHLGEGRVLKYDETFMRYLRAVRDFWPNNGSSVMYDCKSVQTDENGYALPAYSYKAESAVDIYVTGFTPNIPHDTLFSTYHEVRFTIVAREDFEGEVHITSRKGDAGDEESFHVDLKAGETVEIKADTWGWTSDFVTEASASNTYVTVHFVNIPQGDASA